MSALNALPALVIFLSAFLLFLVEPMTAKRLLPMLGGSSAVWITCLVFFQTALLAGYLYAHLLTRRLQPRAQAAMHSVVLALSLAEIISVSHHTDFGELFFALISKRGDFWLQRTDFGHCLISA